MDTLLRNTTKRIATTQQTLQSAISQFVTKAGGIEELCIMTARGVLGLFFIYFGLDKFVHYADTSIYMSTFNVPGLLLPLVILLEVAGGIALLVGWQLKRVAGLLAGFTVLTTLIFHSDFAEQVQVLLFIKNMAIASGLLLFVAIGAGQLSLDAQKASKAKKPRKTK